jgi:hypothetical protein
VRLRLSTIVRALGTERPTRRDLATFGLYAASAGVYIAIGVAVVDFLLSFWVALAYLVATTWLIPIVVKRLWGMP